MEAPSLIFHSDANDDAFECLREAEGLNSEPHLTFFRACGLWTLSCDFVLHNYDTDIKMNLIATHLNAEVIPVVKV